MKRKNTKLLTTRSKLLVLALISLVMFYALSFIVNPYSSWWEGYFLRPLPDLLSEWGLSLLFCSVTALGSVLIHGALNKKLPWMEMPRTRLAAETILNIAFVLLLIFLEITLLVSCTEHKGQQPDDAALVAEDWEWITVSIVIALVISAIHTGDYLINNWKNAALEATEHKLKSMQLQQAAAEAELQALKLQLDPHFVFNNLSVLSELILEDQQLGYEYAENFAKVYRYLLLNTTKDLISLEEELRFARAYIFLLQQRAGNGIAFNIAIDNSLLQLKLPPLTLQLLIENAMKHNKVLKTNPLMINIGNGNGPELIITNTLIPLEKKPVSAGVGLKNIIKRYQLLSDREPKAGKEESMFSVTIPLLAYDK